MKNLKKQHHYALVSLLGGLSLIILSLILGIFFQKSFWPTTIYRLIDFLLLLLIYLGALGMGTSVYFYTAKILKIKGGFILALKAINLFFILSFLVNKLLLWLGVDEAYYAKFIFLVIEIVVIKIMYQIKFWPALLFLIMSTILIFVLWFLFALIVVKWSWG